MNLENPLEHNKIDIIKEKPKKHTIKNVLSNSFGFGGTNVSLIFKNLN
jgi:3-oxoacyl-[acyl-carrier-protein] synthase II